ncbi:calpain-A-like isoform X2 [Myzus persicae]|uniref:calpain-A-like isoform X2 n=1 Tax=Myzus persicae TaxID=13164 RepID=UPI000B92FCD3|nr:calpain-A-like isoform X2 [Myzus persicae]
MLNIGERRSGFRQRPAGFIQDFDELRNQCLKQKILFKDPEFDTYDLSVFHKNLQKNQLEWRRPKEITNDPKFFVQGASRFDVRQGKLGDCWLVAAIAAMTLNKEVFCNVVPNDQGFGNTYAGIFHFKFWQYGTWINVVVDDRLPTSGGELLFVKSSTKNEFWSALLEKAYAKIQGSYEALDGGLTNEAMEAFTGGVSEMYELDQGKTSLFTTMLNSFQQQSLMCGRIYPTKLPNPEDKGIFRKHAYSITKVIYIPETNNASNIPLIRLRNPWGKVEWNGRWSDKSDEWFTIPPQLQQSIGLIKEDDGEFWMSYKDFAKYFSAVVICHLAPDYIDREQQGAGGPKKWDLSIFEGQWVRGVTAGGCNQFHETFSSNPQYYITLGDPDNNNAKDICTVVIALLLKGTRRKQKQKDKSSSFGIYVYDIKELALNSNKSGDFSKKFKKYFFKVAGSDMEVDWMELKNILDFAMKETGKTKFSNDVCRCLIAMMDWDRSGKLGYKEFQRLWVDIRQWQVVFETYDKKNKGYIKGFELRPALSSVGYHIKTRTINTMCHRYANKKGYIMFDDFIMCAIRLKTTIDSFTTVSLYEVARN